MAFTAAGRWKAMGKEEIRWDELPARIKALIVNGFLQLKTWRDVYPGIMHGLIFFGFFVLIFGAAFDAGEFHITEPLLGWSFNRGNFYLGFAFLMQAFGLCVLIGVLMAMLRRYVIKPERLAYKGKSDNTADDAIALLLILGIVVTGFLISALRIHVTYQEAPWEWVRFVSWSIAAYVLAGLETSTALTLHKIMWWTHTFIVLGFIAYIPYSRLLHIITTPANHFFASLKPTGYIEPIRDIENQNHLAYASWKNLHGNRFLIPTPVRVADAVRTVARLILPVNIYLPRSWFRILRRIGWK